MDALEDPTRQRVYPEDARGLQWRDSRHASRTEIEGTALRNCNESEDEGDIMHIGATRYWYQTPLSDSALAEVVRADGFMYSDPRVSIISGSGRCAERPEPCGAF